MKSVYVNSAQCISPQPSLEEDFFGKLTPFTEQLLLNAIAPNYKDYISPALIRRMSKTVKMSSVAAHKAMQQAGIHKPDAIIVGTGMGCEEDSEKFLKNIIENNEEFLTPTHFIQSTHNTVAGQIALANSCHTYNFTYVNTGSSLEMSLLDAKLQLENDDATNILVGATDEKAARTMELYQLNGTIKREEDLPADFLQSKTKGVIWGEGSAFFILSTEKNENALSQIIDIYFTNRLVKEEAIDFVANFLQKNELAFSDIDVLMLGYSSDQGSDFYYDAVASAFESSQKLYFKHLCGEFNTASGFAFFMANKILQKQEIPKVMQINNVVPKEIKTVLLYNHLGGEDHSLVLLKKS